jgi:hypothetical protein
MTCSDMRQYTTGTKVKTIINQKKNKIMKNATTNQTPDIFKMYTLSIEEMISVRGGELDPVIKTTTPPVKI